MYSTLKIKRSIYFAFFCIYSHFSYKVSKHFNAWILEYELLATNNFLHAVSFIWKESFLLHFVHVHIYWFNASYTFVRCSNYHIWHLAELMALFQSFPSNQMRFESGHWRQKVATPKWQPLDSWFLQNSSKAQNVSHDSLDEITKKTFQLQVSAGYSKEKSIWYVNWVMRLTPGCVQVNECKFQAQFPLQKPRRGGHYLYGSGINLKAQQQKRNTVFLSTLKRIEWL